MIALRAFLYLTLVPVSVVAAYAICGLFAAFYPATLNGHLIAGVHWDILFLATCFYIGLALGAGRIVSSLIDDAKAADEEQ
ncbi:MAG: hypothetical protein ACRECW_18785 [Phyllobacterium sp.]